MADLSFSASAAAGPRLGTLTTAHGSVATPAVVPLAARGAVGSISVADLRRLGVQAIAASLYALVQRPGVEALRALGGLHAFIGWNGPLVGDPGDREIAALGAPPPPHPSARRQRGGAGRLLRVREEAIAYTSFVDGGLLRLSPEESLALQQALGADLCRAPLPALGRHAERLGTWGARATAAAEQSAAPTLLTLEPDAAHPPLSGPFVVGYACRATPPRAGWPDGRMLRVALVEADPPALLHAVQAGADLVVSDAPLSAAMRGIAFTASGPLGVCAPRWADDPTPLDPRCACATCSFASRAYLHHLFAADEMSGPTLLALHNLALLVGLERAVREWIESGAFDAPAARFLAEYEQHPREDEG